MTGQGTPDHQWIGTTQAARRLGINVTTLYRLIDREGLPAYQFARSIRLRTTDIDAWVTTQRIQPGELRSARRAGPAAAGASDSGTCDTSAA